MTVYLWISSTNEIDLMIDRQLVGGAGIASRQIKAVRNINRLKMLCEIFFIDVKRSEQN